MDRRDDRHGRRFDQVGHRLDAGRPVALGSSSDEAGDVGAGRERALAPAAQDDHVDVVAELLERVPERVDDPAVDRVDRRVVEPDGLDHCEVTAAGCVV